MADSVDPRKVEYGRSIPGGSWEEWSRNFDVATKGNAVPSSEKAVIWNIIHPAKSGPAMNTNISIKDPEDMEEAGTPDAGPSTPAGSTREPVSQMDAAGTPDRVEVPDAGTAEEPEGPPGSSLAHASGVLLNAGTGALAGSPFGPPGMMAGGILGAAFSPNMGDSAYKGFGQNDPAARAQFIREVLPYLAGSVGSSVGQVASSATKAAGPLLSTAAGAAGGLAGTVGTNVGGGALYDYLTDTHTPEGQWKNDALGGAEQYGTSLAMSGVNGIRSGQGADMGVKSFVEGQPLTIKDLLQDRYMETFNQLKPNTQEDLRGAVRQGGTVFPIKYADNLDKAAIGQEGLTQAYGREGSTISSAQAAIQQQMVPNPSAPQPKALPDLYSPRPVPPGMVPVPVPPAYAPREFTRQAVPKPIPPAAVAAPQQGPFVPKPTNVTMPEAPPVSPFSSAIGKYTMGGPESTPISEDLPVSNSSDTEEAASHLMAPTRVQQYLADKDFGGRVNTQRKSSYVGEKNLSDELTAEDRARYVNQSNEAKQQKTAGIQDYLSGKNEADQVSLEAQENNFDKTQREATTKRLQDIDAALSKNDAIQKAVDYHTQSEQAKADQSLRARLTVDDQNKTAQSMYQQALDDIHAKNMDLADRQAAAPQQISDAESQRRLLQGLRVTPKETSDLQLSRVASGPLQSLLRNIKGGFPNSTLGGLRQESPVQTDLLRSSRALGITPQQQIPFSDSGPLTAGALLRYLQDDREEKKDGR